MECPHFLLTAVLLLIAGLIKDFCAHSHNGNIDGNFRRLQEGDNSDEVLNQCCKRESKFVTVGYGVGEGELRIDIGQCRQKCESPVLKPLKREEFDKFLKKYPHMDPIQIFLSLQNAHAGSLSDTQLTLAPAETASNSTPIPTTSSSCLSSSCQPKSIRREKHFSISGQENYVDVIESCDCIALPQPCQRISSPVRIHVGTPYEKIIDEGRCLGSCNPGDANSQGLNSGQSCRPVRNKTVTVEGPNGAQCMQVIDECECVGDCYLIREFYKVYDYSNVFEQATNTNVTSASSELSESESENVEVVDPVTKLVGMGRCGGTCLDTQVASKCLIWSSSNGTCLSFLYGGHSQCTATKFVSHSYMSRNGQRHNLISVTGCGCR